VHFSLRPFPGFSRDAFDFVDGKIRHRLTGVHDGGGLADMPPAAS